MNSQPREPDVLLSEHGCLGRITLNRPKVINALTHPMIQRITRALAGWEPTDPGTGGSHHWGGRAGIVRRR
jgi:enoyl-CoA hydratase/carnithine racemase